MKKLNKKFIICISLIVLCLASVFSVKPYANKRVNNNIQAVVTTAPAPKGDINFDGIVDMDDANLALKAALNMIELSDAAVRAGDINGNGVIDMSDAKAILNMALGIE